MNVGIFSDKTAESTKQVLVDYVNSLGHNAYTSSKSEEYPDMAVHAALYVRSGLYDRAITVCATGQGPAMMANKVKGIYACPCYFSEWAPKIASSFNAQIITLGWQINTTEEMQEIVKAYLGTEFGNRTNMRRMRELEDISYESS